MKLFSWKLVAQVVAVVGVALDEVEAAKADDGKVDFPEALAVAETIAAKVMDLVLEHLGVASRSAPSSAPSSPTPARGSSSRR
jgi:hypothetical protein